MTGNPKPIAPGAATPRRVAVSDVRLTVQGAGPTTGGRDLASVLSQVGHAGMVDAMATRILSDAVRSPGGRALTRRDATEIAQRIVDQLTARAGNRGR